jgi:dTMP kinase
MNTPEPKVDRPGTFVVFEGGDACGKTTQVAMLGEKLAGLGVPVLETSFPRYASRVGRAISRHLRGEVWLADGVRDPGRGAGKELRDLDDTLVFQALQILDKYEGAADVLRVLGSGYVVVSSRWYQSAEVYGADDGIDVGLLRRAHACLPRADVSVLLHLSSEASLALRPDLRDRFERDRAKQDRVRQGYLDLWVDRARAAHADGCGRSWPVVYCEGKSAAEVHDEVWDHVLRVPGFAERVAASMNDMKRRTS